MRESRAGFSGWGEAGYSASMSVRVRYAPSPTGLQHIGGVRTALYNYFFAKSMGGVFYLRIEDTDQGRYDQRAVDDIYETFAWLGISLDEGPREGGAFGPYVQSERIGLYTKAAEDLIATGKAYRCFCTADDLEKMRAEQTARGEGTGYDRRCRHLDPASAASRAQAGERHVVRFKLDTEGETPVKDILLGTVNWPNKDVSPDPVILKADGFPTYHLAHAVDDHYMQTTHVLRGQEWLPSAPLHVQLFKAFGWEAPVYCHLSMIMGSDGHKLSKRHGSTSAQEFRKGGYVREAVINYVTLLGWSFDGEKTMFAKEELESIFSLEKLSKSPAVFDYQKLDWFNGTYIRQLSDADLADRLLPFMVESGSFAGGPGVNPSQDELTVFRAAITVARERLVKLTDGPGVLGFLFADPPLSDPALYVPKKQSAADVANVLEKHIPELAKVDSRTDEENEAHFHGLAELWDMKLGQILMPLRLAVTGTSASPPLMASIRLLGKDRAIARVQAVIGLLRAQV